MSYSLGGGEGRGEGFALCVAEGSEKRVGDCVRGSVEVVEALGVADAGDCNLRHVGDCCIVFQSEK